MANMIYADDLKQAMKDARVFDYVKEEVVYKSAWGVPIVDAEEVVRCKDCKWYRNRFNQHYCCLTAMDCPLPDDYCSRAERKDEVEE